MSDPHSTVKFCKKCQTETERNSLGRCTVCSRAAVAKWRASNLEKIGEYYQKNKEKIKAKNVIWCASNPDKVKSYSVVHYEKNKENIKIRSASNYACNKERKKKSVAVWKGNNKEKLKEIAAAWRAANPDKVKAYTAAWRAKNPLARRLHFQNYRASKRKNGGTLSKGLSGKLFKLQRGKCACCGLPLGDNFHLDHVMPLFLGGSNTDSNMQLLRQRCNSQKAAKHPVDFMQSRGFLL